MEMNSFVFMKSDSPIWNPSVSVTVSSSSFSSVLISTTFFASSVIESTLELLDSTFFNISAKQNASMQEQNPNSCSITISNSAFNHVYGVYDGVLIPSISADARSLDNFNTTHISCSRWENKHYTNETLKRVVLDPSVDKEFTFDLCIWKRILGFESGQCIFVNTQDEALVTLTVKRSSFESCKNKIGSGGAIFVKGNVAVTLENSSFQDIICENENKNVETAAGAVHVISIRSPAIRKCLFFDCSSNADACVVFERKLSQIPERKTNFCGNHTIWHQNNYSQIRERNNFPHEGNDMKMQTEWNSDPEEFFEEVEPVCVQSVFTGCASKRSGGGLYLKDVEDQALVSECDFSSCKANYGGAIYVVVADAIFLSCDRRLCNQDFYCIYMSYFAVNTADKYGHDAFVVSEADYDDGLKLFSLCKTSKLKEGAVVQMKRSKPDEIFFLSKSLEIAQRVIELDSTAKYNAACGSSTKLTCRNIFQALTRIAKSEDVKFSIDSDAKTFEDASCIIDGIDLEIDGNNGGVISIGTYNFTAFFGTVFLLSNTTFKVMNLTILCPKMEMYPYNSIFHTANYENPSTISLDHIVFKYDSESKPSHNIGGYSAAREMLFSPATFKWFYFFHLANDASLTIIGSLFCCIPAGTIRSILSVLVSTQLTILDCVFQNISTHHEYSVLFNGVFYQSNYVAVRNITTNLITTVSPFGGFAECSMHDGAYFAITNSSFKSCSAVKSGGALSFSILKDASLILDQLSFFNNSAEKYRDMRIFTYFLPDINIQRIFSFVDESVDGTQIGGFDIGNYKKGISIKEFLSVYSNSTIFVSSSRGVDFTRCGTFNLPCRSLSYGWAHLDEPRRLIVVDLAYLTLPTILEKAEICSSNELGIAGKVEVNVKYSSSWREVILLNGSVKFERVNLVLHPMTNNTKNAITVIRGASLWIKMIISFSSITEEQSIDYMLFNIEGGDVTFDNLSIKGDKTLITAALFNIVYDADLLQLKDVSIENMKIKHDMISISPDKSQDTEWMDQMNRQTILISNLSFIKMNDLTDSEKSSGNAEEILGGRLLRSRESPRQKLELHNSSLSGLMSPDNFEPYGGCIYWSGKKRDGKDSSTASEDDEAEESSELLFKNCTFCNDGLDTQLHEKETKGGAIYLEFDLSTFPFVFQDVCLFENKANTGNDIFFRCTSIINKDESKKFGINFHHPLWREQNSIVAESEEDGEIVDYLEFAAYRNSIIYVSGYDSLAKNCRTEQTSTFSSHSSSNFSQCINDGYEKQESGWDIFFCGSEDDPCRTVNYAMTHLTSPTSSISQKVQNSYQSIPDFIRKMQIFGEEDKDEHLTLHIVGEPSIFNSVMWNSLSVEGEADRAGLLFEKSEQEVNKRQGIKQKSKLCKCNEQMDVHVVIKGNCRMNNTNIKITANLPVSCLFLIDDEGTFEIERCTISSLNELMIIPTIFKIEAGTLLCTLMNLNKVQFRSESFFIDCFELVDESKVNVQLNECSLNNITVNDQKSLILFSTKEKSFFKISAHNRFTESTSLFTTTSFSSNISSHNQALSSSHSNLNTSSHDEKSSIPLHVPLKFVNTSVSFNSHVSGKGFFLATNRCSYVEIAGCSFLYVNVSSSTDNMQKDDANDICFWSSSFLSFVDSLAYVRNTTFRTKLEGAIYSENSYLSIDVGSMKGNSIELEAFPSVAHNIKCKIGEAQENDDKGTIELLKGAGSSTNLEYKVRSIKSGLRTQNEQREEEINEEFPDNFWIENDNCSLVGFPSDMMSSLFTPHPVNVSSAKSGERYEVTLKGKYLLNCNLLMVLLANQTNAGKFTDELVEIAVADKLNSGNENAVSAIFPLDAMERADGSDVYVVLKFSTESAFNKDLTTVPLRVSEGNNSGVVDDTMMIIIIAVSAVVVGVGFAVALLFVRRRWRKKMLLTEYEEKKSLLSSINSDFQGWMRIKEENTAISSNIYDYGTTTKQIDIPSDSQEPFLEE
ncbi:uncharacterized protein MONOS_3325 [Monocercomonoides exilis]|uniref:uncharacterized protein n=1 Tax=Monocercomonoides exilis TaxID=2049356 RepID=UPI00355A912D|nr:hypothetical protein MONOS_3325 [Monocercomonoides exilis]|eukprot:MONOS_3325.1-p1 / transcript=MONOS_3325.1 / gene=MONOS_3325 / organism=Monocercomonoides_exilis_PA203 / gene_product=unspecified product / transcript_product=unspecified product / location=Mono_scaffold00077:83177-89089(-) / protein_length=1971 / sequence_SO=supercontig / SO=protein_coding / is_pseudo=false